MITRTDMHICTTRTTKLISKQLPQQSCPITSPNADRFLKLSDLSTTRGDEQINNTTKASLEVAPTTLRQTLLVHSFQFRSAFPRRYRIQFSHFSFFHCKPKKEHRLPVTFNFDLRSYELDLDNVKMVNRRSKFLRLRSSLSTAVKTHTHSRTTAIPGPQTGTIPYDTIYYFMTYFYALISTIVSAVL